MSNHHEKRFLKEIREITNRDVDLSKESFYSGEFRMHYKKLIVDGQSTHYKVDLYDLQDTGPRGKMQEQVRHLARALMLN